MSSQTQHLVIICAVIAAVVILACVPGVREVFSQALSGLLGLLGLHTGHSIATNSNSDDNDAPAAAPAMPSTLGAAAPMPAAPMPAAPMPAAPPEVADDSGVGFCISSGIICIDGQKVGTGYSGFPPHVGKVEDCELKALGPIPCGRWTIGPAFHDDEKGPCVMSLSPCAGTETFGRGGFLVHGDSREHPGEASHGCVIAGPAIRQAINACETRVLTVVA